MSQAGLLSALPYMLMAVVVQIAGVMADYFRAHYFSTTVVRKLFTCGAFICQTIFMICAAYVGSPGWAIACLTMAVGLGGFAWAGFSINPLDIAPQYASILMGISNTFATIPGYIFIQKCFTIYIFCIKLVLGGTNFLNQNFDLCIGMVSPVLAGKMLHDGVSFKS